MTMPPPGRRATGRRDEVLQLLRESDHPLGIAEIADRLGIHANTARFHLDTLLSNGRVERSRAAAGTLGRPAQLFQAVRGMDPTGPRNYQLLAQVLVAALASEADPSRRAAEAGRAWGHLLATAATGAARRGEQVSTAESVGWLTTMLDELGFAAGKPQGGDRSRIDVRSCPFLELAVDHAEVVCPVHLGLMQGAMTSWDSNVTVDRLDAFVEPDVCVVHLSGRGA